jgi:hypothetical protein
MSRDALSTPNGLKVEPSPAGSRRRFLKRAAIAGAGAAAVPLVGAATAEAGTTPAYVDDDNTFTGNQRFNGRLGIRTDPQYPFHLVRNGDPGWAAKIESDTNALIIGHNKDLSGKATDPYDVIDLYLRSTGDGIFGAHLGGVVTATTFTAKTTAGSDTLTNVSSFDGLAPGTLISGNGIPPDATIVSTNTSAGTLVMSGTATDSVSTTVSVAQPSGTSGGNAMFNALIPYYLDDAGDGRRGSIKNTRGGMLGIRIESQAPGSSAINVDHYGNGPALFIRAQSPGYPTGTGGPISLDDYSTASSITILKGTVPTKPILNISTPGVGSAAIDAIRVSDSGGGGRFLARTDGTLAVGLEYPYHSPTGARLQAEMPGQGIQRTLALSNTPRNGSSPGDGVQIEFRVGANQWAVIQGVMDATQPSNSSLRFRVRDNTYTMVEQLRIDGVGLGFYGATPAAKPTVSGSRNNGQAVSSLINALAKLGLIKDQTTAT